MAERRVEHGPHRRPSGSARTLAFTKESTMRLALTAALAFGLGLSVYAADGADANKPAPGAAPAAAATDGKAVNTVCPMDGAKVDSKVAPVEAKTKDGKTVLIGACCASCAAEIKKTPDKFIDAAVGNKKVDEKVK
jgi:hypothetical protein